MRPRKVVLCVDGDEARLSRLAFLLKTRGFGVLRAATGEAAIAVLSETQEDPYVLVTEMDLPDMTGNALVEAVREIADDVRTLVVSHTVLGFDHECEADVFLPRGCNSPAELVEAVRVLCARKRGPNKQPRAVA